MIIYLNDMTESVKINFIESLVLLFMPCETFGQSETDEKRLDIYAHCDEGIYKTDVSLKIYDEISFITLSEREDKTKKLQCKNLIGRAFMKAAKEVFGYTPPWGISTGIRPVKLAADYLRRYSDDDVQKILCDEYLISPKKASMCIRTAEKEMRITDMLHENTCSLYVSVPFCPSRCRYCSFVSSATPRLLAMIPEYLEALLMEITDISVCIRELGLKTETVYIGGGTPAIIDACQIQKLLKHIDGCFDIGTLSELTFEAGRPDSIDMKKLEAIKCGGATRISINTQTTNNGILCSVGRKHTFEDYLKCMEYAQKAGIDNINTDLIAGLPGETYDSFCKSVDDVIAVTPKNITVHAFTLKKSSEYKTEHLADVDANSLLAGRMIDYSAKTLLQNEYEPYYMYRQKNTVGNLDNTGYTKKGYECLYNIYMMGEYHTVFAAGAGGATKFVSRDRKTIKRIFSPKYPYEYLDRKKYAEFDRQAALDFYKNLY